MRSSFRLLKINHEKPNNTVIHECKSAHDLIIIVVLATSDLFQFWECKSNYTVYYIDFTPLFVLWLKNEIVFHYWMLIYCIRLWLHWYCDVMQWNKQFISLNDITVISVTWKSRYFISIYAVLMMNTGPPAQDQSTFVLTSKFYQFLFRTI